MKTAGTVIAWVIWRFYVIRCPAFFFSVDMFFGASSSESKQTGNTTKSENKGDAAFIFKLLKTEILYSLPIVMDMH